MENEWTPPADAVLVSKKSWTPPTDAVLVKKKEKSVLASNGVEPTTSSATKGKGTPQSSGSSAYKEIKEYTGFPGREENKYRVVDNNWQRKKPNESWSTVRDANAIIGLNKQFKKTITPNEGFEGISSKLIDNSEETVVPYLQKNYGNLGFKFEQTGVGDRVRVITEDGKNSEVFALDNWTDAGDSGEALRMKAWLSGNVKTLDREKADVIDQEIKNIKNVKPSKSVDLKADAFSGMKATLTPDVLLGFTDQMALKEKQSEAIEYNKNKMNKLLGELAEAKKTTTKTDDEFVRAKIASVYDNKDELAKQNRYISDNLNDIARTQKTVTRRKSEYEDDLDQWNKDLEDAGGVETPDLEQRRLEIQGQAAMLDKEISDIEFNVSENKKNTSKLEKMAGEVMLQRASQGSTGGAVVNSFIKGATSIGKLVGMEASSQKELIKALGSDLTTEEYKTSEDRGTFEQVLFSVAESLGAASTAAVGGGAMAATSFFAQSYYGMKDEINSNEKFKDVPEEEKQLLAVTYGLTIGWLEKFGIDKVISKTPIGKKLTNSILTSVIKGLPKGAPAELIEEAVNSKMKYLIAKGAVNITAGAGVEFSTEFTQSLAESGIKELYNTAKKQELFKQPESILGTAFENGWMGAIGGFVMQAPIQAIDVMSKGLSSKNLITAEVLEKAVTDSELRAIMVTNIKDQIVQKQITREEGQQQIQAVNDAASVFSKIPDNVSDIGRAKSFDLLIERSKIEKEIEGKDASLVDVQNSRITEINNELKIISNATKENKQPVQEGTVEGSTVEYPRASEGQQEEGISEGSQRETTQPVTDRGDSVIPSEVQQEKIVELESESEKLYNELYDKNKELEDKGLTKKEIINDPEFLSIRDRMDAAQAELDALQQPAAEIAKPAQKITIDKPTITTNTTAEVQRVKSLAAEAEDGATLNLDGSKYEGVGLVVPVDSVNTTMEELTPEMIADFVEERQDMIGDAGVVKAGIYKFPNSNQVSIDLSVVVPETSREQAIEFGRLADQESLFDLGTFENVKTGGTGKNPMKFTPEQHREIATALKEGRVPNVFGPTVEQEVEAIGQFLSGTDTEIDQKAAKVVNKKISKAVARAAKAVSKIIPGTKFVVHDTDESYRAATKEEGLKQSSNGEFNPRTNTIHINGASANNRTVAHEVFHAILINRVKTDARAAIETKRMLQNIASKLDNNPTLKKELDDFISKYDENIQNEEKLAELVGKIAENYETSPETVKEAIARWIDKLAKMFGLDPFNRNETYDMLNTIARKVAKGKVISEADVNPLIEGVVGEISVSEKVAKRKSIAGEIIRFDVNKNSKVEENTPLSRFNGKKTNVFESDRMTGGYIASDSGAVLFNFLGGVNFPAITGKWWASKNETKASNLAKNANANRDADGYIYGTPMVGSDKQHMSNNDMLVATLELMKLDAISTKTKINKPEVIRLINKAFETKNIKLKKPILVDVIKKSNNVSNIFSELEYILFQDGKYIVDRNNNPILDSNGSSILNLTFEDRKAIVETLLGNASVRDVNFPSAGNAFEAAKRFEEPLTEKAKKIGDVVTVMRTKGALKWKKTENTDEFYHKSYPYEIYAENEDGTIAEIEMFILDSAYSMRDIFPSLTKSSGESFTWDEYFQKHGPKSDKVAEAQYNRTAKLSYASGEITASTRKQLSPEVSDKLTDDGSGNFVFHHYSNDKRDTIKPGTGQNIITGKEEGGALSAVGGLAMYYTMDNQVDPGVGNVQHTVLVPNDKVYDFNKDPENFYDEAKKRFEVARPSQSFGNPNYQLAFITQVANENGYDMVVAKWRNNELRAQTTIPLETSKENVPMKPIEEETYKVGDDVEVYGSKGKITSIDGDIITFKGEGVGGGINFKRFPKQISKQITPRKQIADDVVGIEEVISPRKQKPKTIDEIVKLTKDQGFSDASIRQYLKNQGYSSSDINNAFESQGGKKITTAKEIDKSLKRPVTKKTVNEYTALKDQLRLEAKAARGASMDLKQKQRSLIEVVKSMAKTGKITVDQATVIMKKIGNLNLDNPTMVSRFIDYAGKVFERADYQQRLSTANSIKKKIKKSLKKDRQAETIAMAKEFSKIDPATISDIDAYIDMANTVYESMRPSGARGINSILRESANIDQVSKYTEGAILEQEEYLKNELKNMYKDLVDQGIIDDSMSLSEIKELINGLNDPTAEMPAKEKEKYIKDYIRGVIDTYAGIINHIIEKGEDPITGESIELDSKEKLLMSKLLDVDVDLMNVKSAFKIVDLLNNFVTNKVTSSVEGIVAEHDGINNADRIAKSGFVARDLGSMKKNPIRYVKKKYKKHIKKEAVLPNTDESRVQLERAWFEQIATVATLSDTLFKGVRSAASMLKNLGFSAFSSGVAYANTKWNSITDSYSSQFKKSKPNGEAFNTAKNIYERGLYAFVARTVQGGSVEQKAELKRKIGLIEQSIKVLREGNSTQKQTAEIYQELYDKLGLSDTDINITDIESRVDAENVKAVNWWVDQWSEHYSDLSDVSLSVYNTMLGKDINYTPDSFSTVKNEDKNLGDILEQTGGSFASSSDYVYDKKTGVLMESNRTSSMNTNRYVSLDFDTNNAKALKSALIDINTAAATRQIAGFLGSDAYKKIIPNAEDRDLFSKRIRSYVVRSRNKVSVPADQLVALERLSRVLSTLGASKALGSVFQAVKQTVPLMLSTVVNAGVNFNPIMSMTNPAANRFISRSKRDIANRGAESQTDIENANSILDKASTSKLSDAMGAIESLNKFWLTTFLSKPDIWIARSAWLAYYKQDLKRQGVEIADWDAHEVNDDAADYAQHMVDRQQNISDINQAGEFMAAEDPWKKITKNLLMPFAGFALNQKSRMYSDLTTATSKTTSKEDRVIALRSLSGLGVEMAAYHGIGFAIRAYLLMAIADAITGDEPTDEDKEKVLDNQVSYMVESVIKDVISPLPITDYGAIWGIDLIMQEYQDRHPNKDGAKLALDARNESLILRGKDELTKEEAKKFTDKWIEDNKFKLLNEETTSLGTYSIASQKSKEFMELYNMAINGEYEQEFAGKATIKKLLPSDREAAKNMIPYMAAHMIGLLPAETSSISRYVMKNVKKKGLTDAKYEKINDVKKELGTSKLSLYQEFLSKGDKKLEGVMDEINWIEENGGLKSNNQQKEYIKLMETKREVTYDDLKRIQKM